MVEVMAADTECVDVLNAENWMVEMVRTLRLYSVPSA